jgi:hypothetical protein
LNAPVQILNFFQREIRLGGFVRKFDCDHYNEFQLVIYSGERLIFGIDVEAHYDAPFVKRWLDTPSFARAINDVAVTEEKRKSRKLNLARWALSRALAKDIWSLDCALQIHSQHLPRADLHSNMFMKGEFII